MKAAPFLLVLLSGCVAPLAVSTVRAPLAPLAQPNVIAFLDAGASPMNSARERFQFELERAGFQVARLVRDDVPYALEIRGDGEPCSGGGWNVSWVDVSVVDLRMNRTVLTVRGSGATEDCLLALDKISRKPIYGTLYATVARELARGWAPARPPPVKPKADAAQTF
jgi:hypothetical protein